MVRRVSWRASPPHQGLDALCQFSGVSAVWSMYGAWPHFQSSASDPEQVPIVDDDAEAAVQEVEDAQEQ